MKRGSDPQRVVDMTGPELRALLDPSKGPRSRKSSRDASTVEEPQDATERKRHCSSWSKSLRNDASIPPLGNSETSSDKDVFSSREPDHRISEARVDSLRRQQLKEQRSWNKDNFCCDYDAAENAIARGIEGYAEYCGGHICMMCLAPESHRDEFVDDYA